MYTHKAVEVAALRVEDYCIVSYLGERIKALTLTVPAFNSSTKCVGSRALYTTVRPIITHFPGHESDHRAVTAQLNVIFMRKVRGSFMCLAYFVDMLVTGCSLQTGTGRRPVDRGRILMPVLYSVGG